MITSARCPLSPLPFPSCTPNTNPNHRRPSTVVLCRSQWLESETLKAEPAPIFSTVGSFAHATIANLGSGFDFLGCSISRLDDHVTVVVDPSVYPGRVAIIVVHGTPRLTLNPLHNCAGIAAIAALRAIGVRSIGISVSLEKGLPLDSGLGSSVASAAAATFAVNALFGGRFSGLDLVLANPFTRT